MQVKPMLSAVNFPHSLGSLGCFLLDYFVVSIVFEINA